MKLLATLWDDDGAVAVEGLTERDAETPPYSEETLRDEAGLPAGVSPIGTGTILSRIWNKPSITVTGIDAPSVANASNTLSPEIARRDQRAHRARASGRATPTPRSRRTCGRTRRSARSSTSADQDYGDPFLVDTSGWAVAAAREALHEGYGVESVDIGVGGSIPFIADLVREFPGAQILVTGVEDPHARAHSPNESLHLETFRNAVLVRGAAAREARRRGPQTPRHAGLGAVSRRAGVESKHPPPRSRGPSGGVP